MLNYHRHGIVVLGLTLAFLAGCGGGSNSSSKGSSSGNDGTPSTTDALSVSVSGSGTITSNPSGINCGNACSASYPSGTSVTLTASAANGYHFNGWSGGCTGTNTSCTLTMSAATTVRAAFIANVTTDCASSAGQIGVWQNITPPDVLKASGSGIANVAANPKVPGMLYAASYNLGIYKSSDCGTSWTKISTGRNSAVINSGTAWLFAMDPVEPDTLYADTFGGSAYNNLYKSTNGGVDWDPLWSDNNTIAQAVSPTSPGLLSIDPTNHLHLLTGFHQKCNSPYTAVCFAESTDGGKSWSRIVNGPSELTAWVEDASPIIINSTTFLFGSNWCPLYLSTDAGATWKSVAPSGGLRVVSAGGWYYTGGGIGSYSMIRSQDLVNWTRLPNTPNLVGGALIGDGQSLYAASRSSLSYVQAPISNGTNWTAIAAPAASDGAYAFALDGSGRIIYSANQGAGLWRLVPR